MVVVGKIYPHVSLMMVEKIQSIITELLGGFGKRIRGIEEIIELPMKHLNLFDAIGVAQLNEVLLYGPL
uniref:Uncharacterized protein n=1 Tax=Phlebotomus papatasi TaxID=29031 RepID=A0A1B0D8G7_PHLPP